MGHAPIMRDALGRSLLGRDIDLASETREMSAAARRDPASPRLPDAYMQGACLAGDQALVSGTVGSEQDKSAPSALPGAHPSASLASCGKVSQVSHKASVACPDSQEHLGL